MTQKTNSVLWLLSQIVVAAVLAIYVSGVSSCRPRNGTRELHVLSTNDVHGAWFDSTYVGDRTRPSLLAVSWYVDSIRAAVGKKNVLLIDAGDCLQGDNAAYYFNYVDTISPHLYPRLASCLGYDAVVVGNHDIETGHSVYDRVGLQLRRAGIPWLAGNALRNDGKGSYWPEYKVLHRGGMRVLVLGYTNANIKAWLGEELWSGMDFVSLVPFVQQRVDFLVRKKRPDAVVVAVHSGTGDGDGTMLESQGLDLMRALKGVDFVICSHDHRPHVECSDSVALLNAGSNARNLAHGVLKVENRGGKTLSRSLTAELVRVDKSRTPASIREEFASDYNAVRDFTLREVGESTVELRMRDAFVGPSPAINLIHTVQLLSSGAQISFAAPLSQNGIVPAGTLVFNDMFTIYHYENTLFKVVLTGAAIRSYLEMSYDAWIKDPSADGHVLRISMRPDPRSGSERWSFDNRSYNFDSAAGLVYSVNVTEPFGRRVSISSLADGSPFEDEASYTVAMTSYRASGGGMLLEKGAGISPDEVEIAGKYPEIRDLIYRYISEAGVIDEDSVSRKDIIGTWSFVPENAVEIVKNDVHLLFGR